MPLPWLYARQSLDAAEVLLVPDLRPSQCLCKQLLQAIQVTHQAVQLPISEAGSTIT